MELRSENARLEAQNEAAAKVADEELKKAQAAHPATRPY
jgi:hypothetical protein